MQTVNILGTKYNIYRVSSKENPKLEGNNGICEQYSKEIILHTLEEEKQDEMCVENVEEGLYNLTYNLAIERIGVSYSAIILNISPLFTTVLSAVFFKERVRRCKQIGITINIIGCLLTVLSSFSERGSTIIPIGFLFAFITAVCYAACPIFGKLTDERDSALAVATYSAFFASLFLVILNPVKEVINPLDIKILLVGFMFAVFTTGIADVFYYAGVKNIEDSSKVPVLASSSLFVSAILSVIVFKENINLLKLIGLMMVFISIIYINKDKR